MPIRIETIENSSEMKALQKALTKLQKDALKLVTESKNDEHGLKRAAAITRKLQSALAFESKETLGRSKCPFGTTYDPITNSCV